MNVKLQLPVVHLPDRERMKAAFRYAFSPRVLAQAIMIGVLIAVAVAIWPQFTCRVFAKCGPRERFCNTNCTQGCAYASQFRDVAVAGRRVYDPRRGKYFCDRGTTRMEYVPVRCSDSGSCRVTWSTHNIKVIHGISYVEKFDQTPKSGSGYCQRIGYYKPVTCCLAPSAPAPAPAPKPAPKPKPCKATYGPPSLALSHTPSHPLVITQDPDALGVDVTVTATGGRKTNSCPGASQQTITSITLDGVELAASSVSWIENELAVIYPGAHVKGNYPLHPNYTTNGLRRTVATLKFHLDPEDPGYYDLHLTVRQGDGQVVTSTLQVPVWLFEATIIR